MFAYNTIRHDGGQHIIEVEVDHDQLVIRFGNSFTLRVDEKNAKKLCEIIHDGVEAVEHITRRNNSL